MRSAYLIHCAFATMLAYPTVYARGVAQTTKALVAADLWTPAPIQAPDLFNNILSRRDDPPADSTCGFVSASSGMSGILTQIVYKISNSSQYLPLPAPIAMPFVSQTLILAPTVVVMLPHFLYAL